MHQKLHLYNNAWYHPGAGPLKRLFWYFINAIFFNSFFPINSVKILLLDMFGAKIGKGVVIKPYVNIKYPWRLQIGHYVWIGEDVWIDNLDTVTIESNVCISQGAMLLCGNHDFKKETFDLIIKPIYLEESCWIGAKAIVCPGVRVGKGAILTVGSVANFHLKENMIYKGNPATIVRERKM
jgi:putative colanic acid biosynthesis acetyltransferase WcaF